MAAALGGFRILTNSSSDQAAILMTFAMDV